MPTPFKWIADFVTAFSSGSTDSRSPWAVALPNGGFMVPFVIAGATNTNIYSNYINAGGVGNSARIIFSSANIDAEQPAMAVLADGRRVYVFTQAPNAGGGDVQDVYAVIDYGATGTTTGSNLEPAFLVSGGAGAQVDPVVAANMVTGGFAIAINDQSVVGGQLILKFYSNAGNLLNTITPGATTPGVSGFAAGDYRHISIANLANGNYVVTWYDASPEEARFQIYSASGGVIGSEVTIAAGGNSDYQPVLTVLGDGRFVVVNYESPGNEVVGRLYNADGTAALARFVIGANANQNNTQNVSAATLNDGRFVVVWQNAAGDIEGQVMFANGTPDGASFIANTSTAGIQSEPTVAVLADGRFVVTWTDTNTTGDTVVATIYDPRETNINQSGSSFNDDAYGTSFNDAYYAGTGHDTVRGQGGSDYILGEAGNDSLLGGDATDLLYGGLGNDNLQGEAGDDFVYGGVGDDTVSGAGGNDVLYGEGSNDFIAGDDGNDTVIGGDGNDSMYGYANDDAMDGGADNDTAYGGLGNDFIRGGAGNDVLIGEDGNDQLYGEDGADSLDGGIGADTFYGGAGNDTAVGGAGGDVLIGEAGQDDLRGGDDDDSIDGGADGDTLRGENGNDFIQGQDGDDFIDGGANVDDLRGGNGNDTIIGGSGGDTMYGNAGNDVFRFAVGSGSDAIVGWEDGLDRIDISTYAGATFANTVITQVGGDTRVTFVSGDSVLLIGVSAATVTIADFIT